MGLKSIYRNNKFFIFRLICILAKMTITFEPVGVFFYAVFAVVLRRTSSIIQIMSLSQDWGLFKPVFKTQKNIPFCRHSVGYLVQLETPEENEYIQNYTRALHVNLSKSKNNCH